MGPPSRGLLLATLILTVTGCVTANSSGLPWEFNAPRADGYAIDLVDVKPAPGTPLVAGDSVNFSVKVRYSLSITSHGMIVLVFENEKNALKASEITRRVNSPGGDVTLKERITVPAHAKELRLFIPLVPEGFVHTTGEVTVRYPIKQG